MKWLDGTSPNSRDGQPRIKLKILTANFWENETLWESIIFWKGVTLWENVVFVDFFGTIPFGLYYFPGLTSIVTPFEIRQ